MLNFMFPSNRVCGRYFATESLLSRHIKEEHSYFCSTCNRFLLVTPSTGKKPSSEHEFSMGKLRGIKTHQPPPAERVVQNEVFHWLDGAKGMSPFLSRAVWSIELAFMAAKHAQPGSG
jgi:hypothetical protein